MSEPYYAEARDKGVIFVRYEVDNKPEVTTKGGLKVEVDEPMVGKRLVIEPDALVLSARIDPTPGSDELTQMLKVCGNPEGFFLEAHVKLRPVEFATEGVYLAGLCHAPKSIDETIAQARAAASRACVVISKDEYEAEAAVAALNEDICDGCGICVPVCEYSAIDLIDRPDGKEGEKIARINEGLCKGCGGCVAACPSGAMEQKGFKNDQILAMIDAALAAN
jgi:heterodisulfide reductase subunit A